MKARLLLIPAVLLLFSLTGCKKDDVKPLTFEAVLGSYEGDMITKTSLLGEQTTTAKKTLTIEKSSAEGEDGKITGQGPLAAGFKITKTEKDKISFQFTGILASGDGYITRSELHYKRNLPLGTSEEFSGKKK